LCLDLDEYGYPISNKTFTTNIKARVGHFVEANDSRLALKAYDPPLPPKTHKR